MSADLTRLSAIAASDALARGMTSSQELVEAHLARIADEDGTLKAFVTVAADRARQEAIRSDTRRRDGASLGPFDGIPFAVKDLTDTEGLRTTYGSRVYQDHVPGADELSVARLRAAGGLLLGKTNTPEFGSGPRSANAIAGATANPYDLRLSSGGSSGGSAAAVAAGLVPIAQGTDFGGSVRTPASFCGVVGLRPTPGVIPSPSRPLGWNALVTQGVLARSVADAALMLSLMAGFDRRDPLSRPGRLDPWIEPERASRPLRIGVTEDFGVAPVAAEVRRSFARAVADLASVFVDLDPGSPDCSEAMPAFLTLRAGISHRQAAFVARHRDRLTPSFVWNVDRGAGLAADDYLAAEEARTRVFARFMAYFDDHDLLVAPSASVPPFANDIEDVLTIDGMPLATPVDYLAVTAIVSLVGLPCLSLPAGLDEEGRPFGIQLIAPPHAEALLLAAAARLETHPRFRHQWPSATTGPSARHAPKEDQ